VFKQDNAKAKHQSCGTVHAPDPEMALQIARDVFVRRPDCYSLWVAPAEEVMTRTGESWLENQEEPHQSSGEREFLIFARPNQRDPHLFQRRINAADAELALRTFYSGDPEVARLGVWAVPADSINASQADDEEAWFRPAEKKAYRHGSFYHPDQLLRELRSKDES
jgi:ring-1,2-phenylacetyl-CoA epoxidase subunit PaaB